MMKKQNSSQTIAEAIMKNIVKGKYVNILPSQENLAVQFQVSRTLIRETLMLLVSKGIIEPVRKRGTRILSAEKWVTFNKDVLKWKKQLCSNSIDTREEIVQAAIDWWRTHRPVSYDEKEHLENPYVNLCKPGPEASNLAKAVVKFLKETEHE